MTKPVEHIFTVDVEDYFQVNAFDCAVNRKDWEEFPSRVERSTDIILDLLQRKGMAGTFFTLGWVARKAPALVRRIIAAGHEVASHGWWHRKVTDLTPEEFREEVRSSKAILEDVSGQRVYGFRAPSFSIVLGREWAFDILLEEGYRYDSSLFPIRRPGYGYPSADPYPHLILRPAGALLELPPATTLIAGVRVPAAGGGYFRHLPYGLFHRAFGRLQRRGVSGMFYIHPWELDVDQPRLAVPLLARLRHYGGLHRTLPRLERILSEFRFTSVARRFDINPSLTGDPGWAAALPA
jgi:polysaccharide deacetylase family protein (PEP-CTERM system associated)